MAIPKIFVSSTCYDLYDLRNNLRDFIKSFDYEPVMSEFGDIFYDYNLHVQDACLKEIENCQMFILIVGNNYGSMYYRQKGMEKSPSSVTLTEFRKALSTNLARHIFIHRLVKYDYDNYKRVLDKKYLDYFNSNSASGDEIDQIKANIKAKLDSEYFFPHESYKHIFKFFDIIGELNINNAIYTFETSVDIQEQLKKQWAGFMYEGLINQYRKGNSSSNEIIEVINKIDKIDKLIDSLFKDENKDGKITLDLNTMKVGNGYKELQEMFEKYSYLLLNNPDCDLENKKRGYFSEPVFKEDLKNWLDSLPELLSKYVWSKHIRFINVFEKLDCTGYESDEFIPYQVLFDINNLYASLGDEEKKSFIDSLLEKFEELEKFDDQVEEEAVIIDDEVAASEDDE